MSCWKDCVQGDVRIVGHPFPAYPFRFRPMSRQNLASGSIREELDMLLMPESLLSGRRRITLSPRFPVQAAARIGHDHTSQPRAARGGCRSSPSRLLAIWLILGSPGYLVSLQSRVDSDLSTSHRVGPVLVHREIFQDAAAVMPRPSAAPRKSSPRRPSPCLRAAGLLPRSNVLLEVDQLFEKPRRLVAPIDIHDRAGPGSARSARRSPWHGQQRQQHRGILIALRQAGHGAALVWPPKPIAEGVCFISCRPSACSNAKRRLPSQSAGNLGRL